MELKKLVGGTKEITSSEISMSGKKRQRHFTKESNLEALNS